jgi:hypothetical protein
MKNMNEKNDNNLDRKYQKPIEEVLDDISSSEEKKEIYIAECEKLRSAMLSRSYFPANRFKRLPHAILGLEHKSYKGFFTNRLFVMFYIVYENRNNDFALLNSLLFSKNGVLFGVTEDILTKIYGSEKLKILCENKDQLYYSLVDLTELETARTSYLKVYNRFIKQFKSNLLIFTKETIGDFSFLFFNEKNSKLIIDFFNDLNTPQTNILDEESEKIENIFTLEQFLIKYQSDEQILKELYTLNTDKINEVFKVNNETDFIDLLKSKDFDNLDLNLDKCSNLFIPNYKLKLEDIFLLLNKYEGQDFEFLLSPLVRLKQFSEGVLSDLVFSTHAKICSKEILNSNEYEIIVSKFYYKCPVCKLKVLLEPNDIGTKITHYCGFDPKAKVDINRDIINSEVQTPIILYKIDVCKDLSNNKNKDSWVKSIYVFSFKDNLELGMYNVDLVKFYDSFNILTKNKRKWDYLLLGYNKTKTPYVKNIIKSHNQILDIIKNNDILTKDKTQYLLLDKLVTEKSISPNKLLSILFSIRQYYKNRFQIEVDNSGLFLQITSLLSIIGRLAFKENKLAISVMAIGSAGKTFPCNMIFSITDSNYVYISDSTRLTTAKTSGGINSHAYVNGATVKKFEKGYISNDGVVVADEFQSKILSPETQAIIKSIPQEEYDVAVMGGAKVNFSCTPVFLSNFNQFSATYEKRIIDAYIVKYKSINKFESERRLKTNQDIINYVSQINLYENIEYYHDVLNDTILANVVFAVRREYQHQRLDWKTGSQTEAMNRILFDVVIHRKETTNSFRRVDENTKEIPIYENMPVQQVKNEILQYIYGVQDLDNLKLINLNQESDNSPQIIEQLQLLEKSIFEYLDKEELGRNISSYFYTNVDHFDKKIKNLVIKTIKMLQLIEDINSTKLSDNVKEFANILLLKCKRGLSQEEYDFELNVSEIKNYDDLSNNYLSDLENTKKEMYYDQKREQDIENIEKKLEEEYGLEKKQKETDNSLSDYSIDLNVNKKEFTFKEIYEKFCPNKSEKETTEYVKRLKKDGVIYEPRSGVYKTTTSNGGLDE